MRLIITRHAKSSWDNPSLSDHERPLSKRGRKSADAIGRWLAQNGHIPKVVLCSTSKRTCETWERMEKFMPSVCNVSLEPELYHGSPASITGILKGAADSPALVLGHNPGIGWFAESVMREVPQHHAFWQYPTAATLVCDFPAKRWSDFQMGSGQLVDFVIPREIIREAQSE